MTHLVLMFAAALNQCPVIDTATVAGAIGEVQVKVIRAKKGPGYTCYFTRSDYRLTVDVSDLVSPKAFPHFVAAACRHSHDNAALQGIGNEAIACSAKEAGGMAEKVAVRIRDQAFTVELATTRDGESAKAVRDIAIEFSEQVAGNIF